MSSALNSFCWWLKFKNKFLTATEKQLIVSSKQPIVSSKQPIVLGLTALCRNCFNCYFEFLSVAGQFKRENLGQKICVESWFCSERSYNSHKGKYSKILEIQEPLWLVKDHMWRPCDSQLFLTFSVQSRVKSSLSENQVPIEWN